MTDMPILVMPILVVRTKTSEGLQDCVTCGSVGEVHTDGLARGLARDAVIGVLLRPLADGEAITPDNFARNRHFVDFLHATISERGPHLAGLIAEAKRQADGFVYIIDQRTKTPDGPVPPQDIVGAFVVKDGAVVAGSYMPNPGHVILSPDGFFQLGAELQPELLAAMAALTKPAP